MAQLTKLEFKDLPAMRIVGRIIRPDMNMQVNPIGAFWEQCFGDGTFTALDQMQDHHLDSSYIGWMSEWTSDDCKFTYLCGMLMQANAPVPPEYDYRDVAASTVAVSWIQGQKEDVFPKAHELTEQALVAQGYRMISKTPWCMELYACPRFTQPAANGDITLDYYIPVERA